MIMRFDCFWNKLPLDIFLFVFQKVEILLHIWYNKKTLCCWKVLLFIVEIINVDHPWDHLGTNLVQSLIWDSVDTFFFTVVLKWQGQNKCLKDFILMSTKYQRQKWTVC